MHVTVFTNGPQELSQWRKEREEEALRASVLDEDAAAKFSTAAALAQQQRSRRTLAAGASEPPQVRALDATFQLLQHVRTVMIG